MVLASGPLKLNEKFADCDWRNEFNRREHSTSDYSLAADDKTLIVRRGQPVKFTARLNRPFNKNKDVIKIDLQFGSDPNVMNGTHLLIAPKVTQSEEWFLVLEAGFEIISAHI